MTQVGPLISVHLPKDRINQVHQGFGFAEFLNEKDAEYASLVMNGVRLYGKPLKVNKALLDKQKAIDVGADLYIGNLDPMANEAMLADTFGAFGGLVRPPKIARDPETGESKGYAFVSFENFESSDRAMESMNGQYLMNKPLVINYAFKRDGKGERHGDEAERLLAEQAKKNNYQLPSQKQIQQSQLIPPQQIRTQGIPGIVNNQIPMNISQYTPQIPVYNNQTTGAQGVPLNGAPAFPSIPPPNFRNGPISGAPTSTAGLPMRPQMTTPGNFNNGNNRR